MSSRARRWGWLLAALAVLGGLGKLRFDVEILNLLPPNDPVVRGLRLHQLHFSNADELILTIAAADAETATATALELGTFLRSQTQLASRVLWQPPWTEDPGSLASIIAVSWLNQPTEKLLELVRSLSQERRISTLDETRTRLATAFSPQEIGRLSYDPYGLTRLPSEAGLSESAFGSGDGSFASSDGTFRLMFIKPARPLEDYQDAARWVGAVQKAVGARLTTTNAAEAVHLGWTGRPAFVAVMATQIERDMRGSMIGSVAVIAALFWLAHRRWRPLVWLMVLLGLVMAGTLALGGWMFGTLNMVSLGFAAILFGLAGRT
jgi:predicted RND superfamily exporter protein